MSHDQETLKKFLRENQKPAPEAGAFEWAQISRSIRNQSSESKNMYRRAWIPMGLVALTLLMFVYLPQFNPTTQQSLSDEPIAIMEFVTESYAYLDGLQDSEDESYLDWM